MSSTCFSQRNFRDSFSRPAGNTYRINVLVMDPTDYTTITLWDRECTDLLGRSTSGMRDLMVERTGNADSFPLPEIESLIQRKGLFRVSVKPKSEDFFLEAKSFGVTAMISDPNIWKLYDTHDGEDMKLGFWDEEEVIVEDEEVKIPDEIPWASSCLGGKRKHEIYKEADDPTKRDLDEEFGATKELLKMKAIKAEK
ncbi:unnamed protein product [Cuscuta campestris]|uniref:Replication factor A C-terminal domain-containing protein n=1 Tax=Cuscuta campestris TaxID=132261 RepID=A0A484KG03_9ASTE|nr:unnamed protein product [Cuscuta campestris]